MDWLEQLRSRSAASGAIFGDGASIEDINAVQRDLGVVLPESYVRFLTNLGWFEDPYIKILGVRSGDAPEYLDVVRQSRWEKEEAKAPLPHCMIPISDDGAGNLYCLHVDGGSPGQVLFVPAHRACSFEAESAYTTFEEFVQSMLSQVDSED